MNRIAVSYFHHNQSALGVAVLLVPIFAMIATAQIAGNWTRQIPQNFPPTQAGHALAYDSARGQVVLFGGQEGAIGGLGGSPVLNDTWEWDGGNWTQKSPSTSPSAVVCALAYDSAHGQTVLFGGVQGTTLLPLNETWVWDGANWTQKFPQTSPPARLLHAMAYDSAHGQVVLFGGVGGPDWLNAFNDTWVWDGSNWTMKSPSFAPPGGRFGPTMIYDSAHGQTVLFGSGPTANDTWVWDGTNWAQKSPQTSPGGHTQQQAMATTPPTVKSCCPQRMVQSTKLGPGTALTGVRSLQKPARPRAVFTPWRTTPPTAKSFYSGDTTRTPAPTSAIPGPGTVALSRSQCLPSQRS